ncbi:MAG: preprotein translocase subunit SecA, partial [Clostridia bacterium]|nr:preprotein translocase subunit SecA [Clostridia bacterium]
MFATIVKKVFGSKSARDVKRLRPLVAKINALEESYQSLTEEQLKAKTQEFKDRYAKGESLDSMMCEAFAVVKNACRRMVGRTYQVCGHDLVWDMIPFDVQIIGGIVLHQGKIAEMATGEGKTLVATMPLYLNALSGRNCQLVTVNDYLAMRDSQWVGRVFEYLGLTVGCIQNSMHSAQRKAQYACDITYGTNSEFGFDYLRDMGMATDKDHLVQRDYFYVIIDEVDSILIDEARTPLIISGPVSVSTHQFDKLQPLVASLYRKQESLCTRLLQEAKAVIDRRDEGKATEEEFDEAIRKLLQVKFGMPRHKLLAHILEDADILKRLERYESFVRSDQNRGMLQEVQGDLYFSMDEKQHEADLTERGRNTVSPNDPDAFVLPDLLNALHDIDNDPKTDYRTKVMRHKAFQEAFAEKSERLQNLSQLLRAYCLFEKDVDYVVMDGKVLIVDEHTGRILPGRRFSDGLHQALEAKENVKIESETQTLATITIQNYFRMYKKLAGMTG